MQSTRFEFSKEFRCRNCVLFFAICWIFSIAAGVILATSLQDVPSSLMRSVVISPVSIVGLAATLFLPVVLSAAAVRFSVSWMLYFLSALNGFSFGFCIYFLLISYMDAGWLVGCLVMFSAACMRIPLMLFWIRHIDGSTQHLKRDAVICLLFVIAIGCVDYFLISPFALALIR